MYDQLFPIITHHNMKAANPPINPSANKSDFLKHFLIVGQKPTPNVVEAKLISTPHSSKDSSAGTFTMIGNGGVNTWLLLATCG